MRARIEAATYESRVEAEGLSDGKVSLKGRWEKVSDGPDGVEKLTRIAHFHGEHRLRMTRRNKVSE